MNVSAHWKWLAMQHLLQQCSICCSNAASAADMFDFQQSLMSVGGSKLAEMDLMFVDPGVKDQWCTLPYKSLRL